MWTDLVLAYESKLAVLEEARTEYSEAVAVLIGQVGPTMEAAVHESLSGGDTDCRIESVIAESGGNAILASAPWSCVTIVDDCAGTEFRIAAWVASTWGGPNRTLRVALSLQRVHSALDLKDWVRGCGDRIGESAPGERFDPLEWMDFTDAAPDWLAIRIASIDLAERESRQVVRDVGDIAGRFADAVASQLPLIGDAARPMRNAEETLLRFRPILEARALRAGVSLSPARGLGPWRGGKYLQVGQFWLATDPENNQLVAASNKEDRDVLLALSAELGCPTNSNGFLPVLDEQALRDSERDIVNTVSAAFDLWFDTKAFELGNSGGVNEPVLLDD